MRYVLKLVGLGAVVYAAVLVLMFLLQSRLVFLPQVASGGMPTPRDAGLDFEDVRLRTTDGETIHGWWVPARAPRGAVLLLHGNAGNIAHRIDYLPTLHDLGYSTLLVDYRGYGASTGAPSEQGTYRDASAAWQYLVAVQGWKPRSIVILGESLGGGVATWLALEHAPRALVLASTFTSVPDLAAAIYPWLPVRWLSRIRYDSLARIGGIDAPVFIAHSRDDEVVPYTHGERLFAAAHQPKELLTMSGGHNDTFLFARPEWAAALDAFLQRTGPAGGREPLT